MTCCSAQVDRATAGIDNNRRAASRSGCLMLDPSRILKRGLTMMGDAIYGLMKEVKSLRRQTRILQCCLVAMTGGFLIAASPRTVDVMRARGLVIEDGAGHPRIVLGDAEPGGSSGATRSSATLVFKGENGRDRILIGQEPDPSLNGRVYPRVARGWGMLINAPDGSQRGGLGYLDGRGASISIDRPTSDALGMFVDEKSGLPPWS